MGRVRTHNKTTYTERHGVRHWKDRVMKQKVDVYNNCRITIWKDGKDYTFLVARLVADAFCGEYIDTKLTVNHIDGNRLNNKAENLEWMTLSDNIRDGFNNGLYSATQKRCVLIDGKGNKYDFESQASASRFLQKNVGYISERVIRGLKYAMDAQGNEYEIISYDYSPSSSPNTPLTHHIKSNTVENVGLTR